MLTSLGYIFLVGLAMAGICKIIKIPRIIGMLITGIVLGPYVLNLLDSSILGISSELRQMALIIILIKAGLSLNISDLKKVGRPAILMSFVPATFEILAVTFLAPLIFGISYLEAGIMGAVLGAVSPAVVVPKMVQLMEEKYGTDKSIPQLILAGSSLDDVYGIVVFTTLLGMRTGNSASFVDFFNVPISVVLGITLGAVVGFMLALFFEFLYKHKNIVRNSTKVIIILGVSFMLIATENWLKGIVAVSGILAVISMASLVQIKSTNEVVSRLSEKFGKLWICAEVILFVLVGATVDIRYTFQAGLGAIALIFGALIIRAVSVWLCLIGTKLNYKERLFCIIAYLPKATVQAAIGSIPLSMGLSCGNLIISVSVLAIIICAPLGAFGMDLTYKRLLQHTDETPLP